VNILKSMKSFVLLAAVLLLAACSNEPAELTAAPLGERAALESLAASYTTISDERLSVSPMSLNGEDRKKFVTKVFASSGYSYTKTLRQLVETGLDKSNKLHVDMAELVLMPHRNPRHPVDLDAIYSAQELQDIAVIERQLKR